MTLQSNGHPGPSSASRQSAPFLYQRLGLVAQELGHWDEAEGWYGRALRESAEAADYSACAKTCHQLSETFRARGRLGEALAFSVLAFAAWEAVPDRERSEQPSGRIELPPDLHLGTVEATWRTVTGTELPSELSKSVEQMLASGVR